MRRGRYRVAIEESRPSRGGPIAWAGVYPEGVSRFKVVLPEAQAETRDRLIVCRAIDQNFLLSLTRSDCQRDSALRATAVTGPHHAGLAEREPLAQVKQRQGRVVLRLRDVQRTRRRHGC